MKNAKNVQFAHFNDPCRKVTITPRPVALVQACISPPNINLSVSFIFGHFMEVVKAKNSLKTCNQQKTKENDWTAAMISILHVHLCKPTKYFAIFTFTLHSTVSPTN